jgi:hypothetical protein
VLDPSTSPLEPHKRQKDYGRHEDIQAEEGRDPIGEELSDKELQIETVLPEERDELGIRQNRADNTERQVRVLGLHRRSF